MAALEGGLAAVSASSGKSAQFLTIANIVCVSSFEVERLSLIACFTRPGPVITLFRGQDSFQLPYRSTGIDLPLSTALYGGVRRSLPPILYIN